MGWFPLCYFFTSKITDNFYINATNVEVNPFTSTLLAFMLTMPASMLFADEFTLPTLRIACMDKPRKYNSIQHAAKLTSRSKHTKHNFCHGFRDSAVNQTRYTRTSERIYLPNCVQLTTVMIITQLGSIEKVGQH